MEKFCSSVFWALNCHLNGTILKSDKLSMSAEIKYLKPSVSFNLFKLPLFIIFLFFQLEHLNRTLINTTDQLRECKDGTVKPTNSGSTDSIPHSSPPPTLCNMDISRLNQLKSNVSQLQQQLAQLQLSRNLGVWNPQSGKQHTDIANTTTSQPAAQQPHLRVADLQEEIDRLKSSVYQLTAENKEAKANVTELTRELEMSNGNVKEQQSVSSDEVTWSSLVDSTPGVIVITAVSALILLFSLLATLLLCRCVRHHRKCSSISPCKYDLAKQGKHSIDSMKETRTQVCSGSDHDEL